MSTKKWIGQFKGIGIYQECFYDFEKDNLNSNPACIQIENPNDFTIERKTLEGDVWSQLTVEVPAKKMDELVIAWCKARNLNTNKYTFDELLVKCDFKFPLSEDELLDGLDDIALAEIVSERVDSPEVEANLEYENIFDVVDSDKEQSNRLKKLSDMTLQIRDLLSEVEDEPTLNSMYRMLQETLLKK